MKLQVQLTVLKTPEEGKEQVVEELVHVTNVTEVEINRQNFNIVKLTTNLGTYAILATTDSSKESFRKKDMQLIYSSIQASILTAIKEKQSSINLDTVLETVSTKLFEERGVTTYTSAVALELFETIWDTAPNQSLYITRSKEEPFIIVACDKVVLINNNILVFNTGSVVGAGFESEELTLMLSAVGSSLKKDSLRTVMKLIQATIKGQVAVRGVIELDPIFEILDYYHIGYSSYKPTKDYYANRLSEALEMLNKVEYAEEMEFNTERDKVGGIQ